MKKIAIIAVCVLLTMGLIAISDSYAAEGKATGTEKTKATIKKVVNYPANVVAESTNVVTKTAKGGAKVVTEVGKDTAGVASGELGKTKDLVVEPIKQTAETTGEAAKGTIELPVTAAKEGASEPAEAGAE